MLISKIINRMLAMSDASWYIFIRSLKLGVILLISAAALINESFITGSHELYLTAVSLNETTQAVLIAGLFASFTVEAAQK